MDFYRDAVEFVRHERRGIKILDVISSVHCSQACQTDSLCETLKVLGRDNVYI